MSHRPRLPRLFLLPLLLASSVPLASIAHATEPVVDGRGSVLWPDDSRIELTDGVSREVALPADVLWSSLAVEPGRWIAAGTRTGEGLVLLEGQGEAIRSLAGPLHAGPLVRQPLLVGTSLETRGMAWLEGDGPRSLAVRFAAHRPDGWGRSETISPPGPGSQLALAGAALGDGRTLLLWSAYDGTDDEILWSVGSEGGWSRPRRIADDNAVPDITPSLVAVGERGALAAWSRYDGRRYRLVVARFDGSGWGAPQPVAQAGDLFPAFTELGGEIVLEAQDAYPARWHVVRLGADGTRLEGVASSDLRPVVVGATPQTVRMRTGAERPAELRAWER